MTNPVFAVEGDIVEIIPSVELSTDGGVTFERLDLRSKEDPSQIVSVRRVLVPADLAGEFKVGVKTRLVLFGVDSLRSRFLAGIFGDTSYLRVPANFDKVRNTSWGGSILLAALAMGSVYKWHGWGCIPAAFFLVFALPFAKSAKAFPSFKSVKKLLEQGR